MPLHPSGESNYDKGLVMETVQSAGPSELPVRVETRHRCSGGIAGDAVNFGHDASVAQHAFAGDAVKSEHPDRRTPVEARQSVLTGNVGRTEDRTAVALHDPDHAPLGYSGDAVQRAVPEVPTGDVANFVTAPTAEAEGMGHREVGERLGVVVDRSRGPQSFDVRRKRRLVVEGEHPVAVAGRDDHRLSHGAPAVVNPDADRAL